MTVGEKAIDRPFVDVVVDTIWADTGPPNEIKQSLLEALEGPAALQDAFDVVSTAYLAESSTVNLLLELVDAFPPSANVAAFACACGRPVRMRECATRNIRPLSVGSQSDDHPQLAGRDPWFVNRPLKPNLWARRTAVLRTRVSRDISNEVALGSNACRITFIGSQILGARGRDKNAVSRYVGVSNG